MKDKTMWGIEYLSRAILSIIGGAICMWLLVSMFIGTFTLVGVTKTYDPEHEKVVSIYIDRVKELSDCKEEVDELYETRARCHTALFSCKRKNSLLKLDSIK